MIIYTSYRIEDPQKEVAKSTSGGGDTFDASSYLLKTGDTATGDYAFDTNTLVIDSVNHCIGIKTTSIASGCALDVNGIINSATGFRIANAAASGSVLVGNGTNFVATTSPSIGTSITTPTIKITNLPTDGYFWKCVNADGSGVWAPVSASQTYKGVWNATTNFPTLTNGSGTQGWWYRCSVAGTVDFGAGSITFAVGDDVSYNGSIWEIVPAGIGYWTLNGSDIYSNNTDNVGIGILPSKKLTIDGDVFLSETDWTTNRYVYVGSNSDPRIIGGIEGHAKTIVRAIDNDSTDGVDIQQYDGASIAYFRQGGNVGIGTISPSANLEVAGVSCTLLVKSTGTVSNNPQISLYSEYPNDRNWRMITAITALGDLHFQVSPTAGSSPSFSKLVITKEGYVGLGEKTAPSEILDIESSAYNVDLTIRNACIGTRGSSQLKLIRGSDGKDNVGVLMYTAPTTFNWYAGVAYNSGGTTTQYILNPIDTTLINSVFTLTTGGTLTISGVMTTYQGNSTNWNAAYSHKTTEDAINGLVKCNGTGTYSAITDNHSNWDTAYSHSQNNNQAHTDYLLNNASDTTSGTLTASNFILSSDRKMKTKIQPLLVKWLNIDYKQFELKSEPGQKRFGVIAQDIKDNYPELTRVDDKGVLSVAYIDLMIREIAYLKYKIADFERRLS